MPHYFASDVHLRDDRPDRDRRFRAWINRLTSTDTLVIAGDLCDFWMGSRRRRDDPLRSPSLRALIAFRQNGGSLSIMAGNHDEWLCPFYEDKLGARIIEEPVELTIHGLRVKLVHGHLLGARRAWKALMEGRAFFEAFGYVPRPIAKTLDRILAWRNERGLSDDEERHLHVYRDYAAQSKGVVDLVVFGHVHRPVDDRTHEPRLIVLGGWQRRSSYLKIDESGAVLHIEDDSGRDLRAPTPAPISASN